MFCTYISKLVLPGTQIHSHQEASASGSWTSCHQSLPWLQFHPSKFFEHACTECWSSVGSPLAHRAPLLVGYTFAAGCPMRRSSSSPSWPAPSGSLPGGCTGRSACLLCWLCHPQPANESCGSSKSPREGNNSGLFQMAICFWPSTCECCTGCWGGSYLTKIVSFVLRFQLWRHPFIFRARTHESLSLQSCIPW